MGRSRATKPTSDQKTLISAAGLEVRSWLVISDTPEELWLVSRRSGATRVIKKAPPARAGQGRTDRISILFKNDEEDKSRW